MFICYLELNRGKELFEPEYDFMVIKKLGVKVNN